MYVFILKIVGDIVNKRTEGIKNLVLYDCKMKRFYNKSIYGQLINPYNISVNI